MALQVYTSNRLELLAAALAETVGGPGDPFQGETIVVQSKGMQRWLAMELAGRLGVWANCTYPFPNLYVNQLCRQVLGELPDPSPYDPTLLRWRIMTLLPRFLDRPAFAPLHGYLTGGSRELKLYQLAGKIADVFDQYTLFRGDLLAAWQGGRDDHWQAELWRALLRDTGPVHRAALKERFLAALGQGPLPAVLPERLTVFGVSYLPTFHLEFLAAVACHSQVNLFIMSPCREYWADILSARSLARLTPDQREQRLEGQPLLASLGRLGRDFSEAIIDCSAAAGGSLDLYRPSPGDSLLHLLQDDILDLQGGDGAEPLTVAPGDRSLRINSCHGPLREVEVLRDEILELFQSLPGLAPRDILVMASDIETYAPYISAVFDGIPEGGVRIPYTIADRTLRREGRLAEGVLSLLDLPGSRFAATRILDLLSLPAVAGAFGFQTGDLERVGSWLEELRIRWGLDAGHRQRQGFPAYGENSWQAGLDRLLLGVALPDQGELFAGVLPFDAMEGDSPRLAGVLVNFIGALADLAERLERPRSLAGWETLCRELLERFFAPVEDDGPERLALTEVLAELAGLPEGSGHGAPVGLPVFRAWLAEALDRRQRGLGFMAGGVTFCAMLPMRSIPFRVIGLLGMDDGMFPRQNRPTGFDLIAREPRRGDRSLRDEDRYLFLEALLSARDCLLISHTGQSIRDNSPQPPSVVVDELLEYLGRRFRDGSGEFPARLVVRHRLQSFSPAYFTGAGPLRSFAEEQYRAVQARREGVRAPAPFFNGPLPAAHEELRQVSLVRLLDFFQQPVRFLLRTRLGIRLDELAAPRDDREPFTLDPLDAYRLRQGLLEQLLCGTGEGDPLAVARARGILPPARQGELLFRQVQGDVAAFAGTVRAVAGDQAILEPLTLDCTIGSFRLTGTVGGIRTDRLLRYRCGTRGGRDQIRIWIEHLLLNFLARPGYPRTSTLVTQDGTLNLAPTDQGGHLLGQLLECHWQGLHQPLKFFPRSSFSFASRWNLDAARRVWQGEQGGEGDDPYYRLCFGGQDPLDGEFEAVARLLLAPFRELCDEQENR